jgi:phosphatidylserine/phosphatidylglycerophosphate/cardiolipin synthase-like enzyme
MKLLRIILTIFLAIVAAASSFGATIEPYFAPGPDPENATVREYNAAKNTIRVEYYGYDSKPINEALKAAKARGVDVQAIFDKCNVTQSYSLVPDLNKAGVPTWIDKLPPIAHNKVGIIDGKTVIEGSYNATNQAKRNAENLVVLHDEDTAKTYTDYWNSRLAKSITWREAIANQKNPPAKRAKK